jgi:hypothetical protein
MLLCSKLLYHFPRKIKFSKSRKQSKYGLSHIARQSYSKIKDDVVRYVSFSKVGYLSFVSSNERDGRVITYDIS